MEDRQDDKGDDGTETDLCSDEGEEILESDLCTYFHGYDLV